MLSNQNSHLANLHAPLSASQNAWTNYDREKLEVMYRANLAKQHGTRTHDFAAQCINLKQRLEDTAQTLNMYVNDAIGFRMIAEQVLFYSMNAYGTADTISDRDDFLRIHDLKTGLSETSFRQLEVYGAYYCLQEKKDPFKLKGMEFRIYQNDEIKVMEGDPIVIKQLMEHTQFCSKELDRMRAEVE